MAAAATTVMVVVRVATAINFIVVGCCVCCVCWGVVE